MAGCVTMPKRPIGTGAKLVVLVAAVLAVGVSASSALVSTDAPGGAIPRPGATIMSVSPSLNM